MEELLPVAVPVYGGGLLGRSKAQMLLRATPTAETRTELEVKETLADALEIETLEQLFGGSVEARRMELAAERRAMKRQMEGWEGARATEWLRGSDDLAPGSSDLLSVTVLIPH